MATTTTTPSPYVAEAYPWVAYGVAMMTAGRLRATAAPDHTYRMVIIAAVTGLVLVAGHGFIRQRSVIPRFAADPWRIILFAGVLAVAIITNPSPHVQIIIAIATCIVVVLRVVRIQRELTTTPPE